jgi:hypothetical protein
MSTAVVVTMRSILAASSGATSYKVVVSAEQDTLPLICCSAIRPAETMLVGVQFAPDCLPKQAGYFTNARRIDGDDTIAPGQELNLSNTSTGFRKNACLQ